VVVALFSFVGVVVVLKDLVANLREKDDDEEEEE